MQNKTYNTKAIVEAAMIGGILAILMLITAYVPIISIAGVLILPIPVTVLYIRQNIKVTISAILLSILLTSVLYSPIMAIYAAINYAIIGITLGYGIKNQKKPSTILFLLTGATMISNIITVAFSMLFIENINFIQFIHNNVQLLKEEMVPRITRIKEMYRSMGVAENQLKVFDQTLTMFNTEAVLILIPSTLLIISFVSSYLNYIVTRAILTRLHYKMEKVTPFSDVYVSNLIGAFLIGAVCIGIILHAKNVPGGTYFFNASQALLQIIFMINGFAAITYFLRKKKGLSKGVTFFIIFITLVLNLSSIYFIIGTMEMALDMRRLDPYRIRKNQLGV